MTKPSDVVETLRRRAATVATAESLTGGMVCAQLVTVAGASDVVRGGVVAYAADLKIQLLDVPAELVERVGTVDPEVARAMAMGARARLGATYGVATTGVAGPDASEGKRVGTVHIAIADPDAVSTRAHTFEGDRAAVRWQATQAALTLLSERLDASA